MHSHAKPRAINLEISIRVLVYLLFLVAPMYFSLAQAAVDQTKKQLFWSRTTTNPTFKSIKVRCLEGPSVLEFRGSTNSRGVKSGISRGGAGNLLIEEISQSEDRIYKILTETKEELLIPVDKCWVRLFDHYSQG